MSIVQQFIQTNRKCAEVKEERNNIALSMFTIDKMTVNIFKELCESEDLEEHDFAE